MPNARMDCRKRRVATEKRFVVHADEKLTAFAELESAIRGRDVLN